ncbi:DUF397 domain-containing protein [Streptomyces sp. P38-E01]|uniref:DUF397 domain-containing protein n=1 Tax=Streptomyces tardus TaxID=2780544 RepID=A0A949JG15_9ACTN|nr:DUF397 domain-containing protein [Streptomyces tardus]MBU7597915.1 DUF397 domain-containing protein [Streptomyces tardus]
MPTEPSSHWIRSSYSGNGGDSCVQWAPSVAATGIVPVRDSKEVRRPSLAVSPEAWTLFVRHLKS